MSNWLKVTLALLLPLPLCAAPAGWAPLLEPDALASILQANPEVRVIRVSGDFADGHIPGSQDSPYVNWRGTGSNPGELRRLDEYGELLRNLGIVAATPVVVVHEGSDPTDMGSATRVYWTLKTLGVADVAVINGGYRAWRAADLPVTALPATVAASDYEPVWHSEWRITTEEVAALIGTGQAALIDARPGSFFRGLRANVAEPGTIRGASNLEFDTWFSGDSLRQVGALREEYAAHGALESPLTVSFCNTGHWASINWFVLSELLQVENTRLYAESMGTWSQQALPMDNQPGRAAVYRQQLADWFRDLF